MTDGMHQNRRAGTWRGRSKGAVGQSRGRRIGCRNQKTIAAAALPKGPSSFYNP